MSRRSTRRDTTDQTALQGDSPAKTSASLESELGLRESDQDSGESLPGSFAWFDPDTSSWRTYQGCLFPAMDGLPPLDEFSETWPRAGTMRNGRVYRRGLLVPHKPDGEYSLSPTLKASDHKRGACASEYRRKSPCLAAVVKALTPTLRAAEVDAGDYQRDGMSKEGKKRPTLKGVLKALTPTLNAASADKGPRKTATKAENGGHQVNLIDVTAHLSGRGGGVLNPTWCEWYMGFPEGWSEIESEDSGTA